MEASESLDIFTTAATFPDSLRKSFSRSGEEITFLRFTTIGSPEEDAAGDLQLYSGGAHQQPQSIIRSSGRELEPNGSCTGESLRV